MFTLITSRRLSLLVVLAYAVAFSIGLFDGSPGKVVRTLLMFAGYFLFPLACIWFGDEMGDYVGTLPGPAINRPTPGWMVNVGGWLLLLLPAIIALVFFLSN